MSIKPRVIRSGRVHCPLPYCSSATGEDPDRILLYRAHHEGDWSLDHGVRVGQHTYSYGASSNAKREGAGRMPAVEMITEHWRPAAIYDLRALPKG